MRTHHTGPARSQRAGFPARRSLAVILFASTALFMGACGSEEPAPEQMSGAPAIPETPPAAQAASEPAPVAAAAAPAPDPVAVEALPVAREPAAAPVRRTADVAAGPRTHTVKRGETLLSIADAIYGDRSQYKRIFEANRDLLSDPNQLRPGQVLKLP